MDAHRFDDLTRSLADGVSRRRFLGGLAAGLLGAALGRDRAVEAACPPDQVARRSLVCVCRTTGRPPDASGWCGCSNGQIVCGGRCVDPARDPTNCGGCGISCDDGDACTRDRCVDGACRHAPVSCVAGDACTEASCDPAVGCVISPVTCPDDGDACTVAACDPAVGCVSTPRSCDDGNACTIDSCDRATGCVHEVIDCNDGDACTADSCDPATGCVHTAINCDDGDACTVDTCDLATGCVHTPLVCDDGDACTVSGCDPITGCVFTPVADGLPGACTAGDVCCGGVCKGDGGQNCVADTDCCSGVCVLGVCAAACRGEHGVCDNDSDCCGGATCVWTGDAGGICCASGTACGDRCCATGSQVCDAALICCEPADRATTCAGRCGAISDNCDQPVECGFDCQGADPACCDTFCADLAASLFNCGECGNDCTQQGLGSAACCAGACRDLLSDIEHCGACDAPTCTGTEPACCGGACRDLDANAEHCGGCFRRCEPSAIPHATAVACAGGGCLATACEAGFAVVAGACCAVARVCGTGSNRVCCGTGETCCDGECVDTSVDPRHCTGCGNACPSGATCAGGECSQGAFGERCNVPNCVEILPGVLDCSTTLQCVATYLCEGVPSITNPPKDSCLDGRCCIPPGVSCTAPGGNFTWSGVCCCDPSKSCPSVGTC